MRTAWLVVALLVAGPALAAKKPAKPTEPPTAPTEEAPSPVGVEVDLDLEPSAMPTVEDYGYFLGRLSELEKGLALNVIADLGAESRLDPAQVAAILRRLLDESSPPEDFGYHCATCFQRRLSDLLEPLRLQGPIVAAPAEGVIALPVDDSLLKKLDKKTLEEVGGTVPGLVQALLRGWQPTGRFSPWAWARYHARDADPSREPAFFSDAESLVAMEKGLVDPLDAWGVARWLSLRPPRNSFDPGFLLLYFEPARTCPEVRIPTAADTERPEFRPTTGSEKRSGRSEGGAPEWVCPNFPLSAVTRTRYVPHGSYLQGR